MLHELFAVLELSLKVIKQIKTKTPQTNFFLIWGEGYSAWYEGKQELNETIYNLGFKNYKHTVEVVDQKTI